MTTRTFTVTKDKVKIIIDAIRGMEGKHVLVGIPESNADRSSEGKEPITNAALGYIHEFGSPAANIPARPFLIPGVRKATPRTLPHLRAACEKALDGDATRSDIELTKAGLIAESSARREITIGDFVPLSPVTVAHRYIARGTKTRRKSENRYLELIDLGMSPASAQAAAGIKPLINTGQLRRSITSVVRKVK